MMSRVISVCFFLGRGVLGAERDSSISSTNSLPTIFENAGNDHNIEANAEASETGSCLSSENKRMKHSETVEMISELES